MNTRGYAQTISIDVDAATAWSACTDAAELRRWYASEATLEPRRGGRWRIRRRDGATVEGIIDVWDVGRRLRIIYVNPPVTAALNDGAPLVDDLLFDFRNGQAVVRILGSGIPVAPEWDRHYVVLRQAWAFYLRELKRVLETPAAGPGP